MLLSKRELQLNLTEVIIDDLIIYFSYETPVAYRYGGNDIVASENIWSRITGKHLNIIAGTNKADRLPYAEFEARLSDFNVQVVRTYAPAH